MSKFEISDLSSIGVDLFDDAESFMQDLNQDELAITGGQVVSDKFKGVSTGDTDTAMVTSHYRTHQEPLHGPMPTPPVYKPPVNPPHPRPRPHQWTVWLTHH
jgi:hypothetical protein